MNARDQINREVILQTSKHNLYEKIIKKEIRKREKLQIFKPKYNFKKEKEKVEKIYRQFQKQMKM